MELIPMGQGPAKQANQEDLDRDIIGFTNPNLHRRIDIPSNDFTSPILSKNVTVGIYGQDSYRTVEEILHDEESIIDEIP